MSDADERMLAVLENLVRFPDHGRGVRELAARLEVSVTAVHRTLSSLARRDFARLTDAGRYRAGTRLYALSSALHSNADLIAVATAARRRNWSATTPRASPSSRCTNCGPFIAAQGRTGIVGAVVGPVTIWEKYVWM
jgi:hypothetical protein